MPHYAELDSNNVVLRVIRADSEEWCVEHLGGVWKRTYYDTPPNVYAGIGFEYVPERDNFRAPQPFPSWSFDEASWRWVPPVPRPSEPCYWDEASLSWVLYLTDTGTGR